MIIWRQAIHLSLISDQQELHWGMVEHLPVLLSVHWILLGQLPAIGGAETGVLRVVVLLVGQTVIAIIQGVALELLAQLQQLETQLLAHVVLGQVLQLHALAQLLGKALKQEVILVDIEIGRGAATTLMTHEFISGEGEAQQLAVRWSLLTS